MKKLIVIYFVLFQITFCFCDLSIEEQLTLYKEKCSLLEQKVNLLQQTIDVQESQLTVLNNKIDNLNIIILYKDDIINQYKLKDEIREEQIEQYKNLVKISSPKWYENKLFTFLGGMIFMGTAVWCAGQLNKT